MRIAKTIELDEGAELELRGLAKGTSGAGPG